MSMWADPLECRRPGCGHPYRQHAPGGAGCMVWNSDDGEHCGCIGFRWVELEGPAVVPPGRPPRTSR